MKRSLFPLAFAAFFTFALVSPSAAQGKKPEKLKPADQKQGPPKKEEPKKEEPKKDPKVEEYERAIKDLVKHEGAFTLYTRKKDILLELPEDRIGKLFLIQAALNTGVNSEGLQAGDPVGIFGVDAFKWQKQNDEL